MKNVILSTGTAIFLALMATLLMPIPGWAHTSLQSSVPANGQTVAEANQLMLEYGVPLRLMNIKLTDAAGKNITLDFKRSTSAQARFEIPISQPLPVSTYQVVWMGMGDDGHKIDGSFSFVVDPNVATTDTKAHSVVTTPRFSGLDHPAAKTVTDFHAALKAADVSAVKRVLAEDVIIFEGGGVERSRAEYESHHMAADMAFLKDLSVETLEHHVRVQGDSAVSLARSKVSGQFKEKSIDHTGMETITLQKRNGNWQITHIHWSK